MRPLKYAVCPNGPGPEKFEKGWFGEIKDRVQKGLTIFCLSFFRSFIINELLSSWFSLKYHYRYFFRLALFFRRSVLSFLSPFAFA